MGQILRKVEASTTRRTFEFTRSLTLRELHREASDGGEKEGVNKAPFVKQKLFDEPKREKE